VKFYLIAGEASGDLHGSRLVRELSKLYPQAEFRAWGGDLMAAAGAKVVKHYRDLSFMGFAEVLANLRTILGNLNWCKADIQNWQPDAVIFIDYPGFNLRLAPFVKGLGIQSIYYISPQLWAWKAGRVKIIRAHVDLLLCILPFEKKWYSRHGVSAEYVGHPLLDALGEYPFNSAFREQNELSGLPIIALLPGSRKQEIKLKLPIMLEAVKQFPQYQAVVAAAPGQTDAFYQPFVESSEVSIVRNQTYDLLANARAALVTSGTATLETALIGCPELVVYKGSPVSYFIGKRLVKVKYISLVNLILNEPLVEELIQDNCTPAKLAVALAPLLHEGPERLALQAGYERLRQILGGPGASVRAAEKIFAHLTAHSH
jgi:lipid-A-disaccharide synthase